MTGITECEMISCRLLKAEGEAVARYFQDQQSGSRLDEGIRSKFKWCHVQAFKAARLMLVLSQITARFAQMGVFLVAVSEVSRLVPVRKVA
jgi:hypothetical protein